MSGMNEAHLDMAVLLRLIVSRAAKPPSQADVIRGVTSILRPVMDERAAKELVVASLERLERDGLRETGRMRATAEGERRATTALGLKPAALPKTWRAAKRLVAPLALGIPSDARPLPGADGLRAEILRRRLGLPVRERATFASVQNDWAARELGMDKPFTLANIRAHLLARAIGLDAVRRADEVAAIAVAKVANAPSASATALEDALVRDWLRGATADAKPVPRDRPLPLDRFAAIVRGLARDARSERFGRDKVFIASLWDRHDDAPELRGYDEASFKARLLDAHREGLLHLSRADLTSAMSPSLVRDSEVPYLNAVFHFVQDEVSP